MNYNLMYIYKVSWTFDHDNVYSIVSILCLPVISRNTYQMINSTNIRHLIIMLINSYPAKLIHNRDLQPQIC